MAQGAEPVCCYQKGRWFDSPGLHVKVSLALDTKPQTAPDVLVGTLHNSHHHQRMYVCMNYCKSLWANASAKCPKCEAVAYKCNNSPATKWTDNNSLRIENYWN